MKRQSEIDKHKKAIKIVYHLKELSKYLAYPPYLGVDSILEVESIARNRMRYICVVCKKDFHCSRSQRLTCSASCRFKEWISHPENQKKRLDTFNKKKNSESKNETSL